MIDHRLVSQRFHIEDLVVQDSSGVLFRAIDTETRQPVALRRFFPFGVDGGGLLEDEQIAYDIAIARLAGINHPALRSITCGGCDPVDGMPYIVTEWVDGTPLQSFIEQGPCAPEQAAHLISQALEVCAVLSHVLTEEAIWIETDVHTIIIGDAQSGRGVTFWISPLKWLGKNKNQRGLEAIVSLTEDLMGWNGKVIDEQSGRGLGGWLKWLRASARTTSLHEARERLATAINGTPAAPTKKFVRPATPTAPLPRKKKSSGLPFLLIGCVALLAISLGGWALIRWNNSLNQDMPALAQKQTAAERSKPKKSSRKVHPPKPDEPEPEPAATQADSPVETEPRVAGESPEQRANRLAQALTAAAQQSALERETATANTQAAVAARAGIFTPADQELLVAQSGQEVILEGVFHDIGYSNSRKTMYLQFSKNPANTEPRGAIMTKDAPAELAESKLADLKGKKIRVRGKVRVEKLANLGRPVIVIESGSAIHLAE